MYKRRKMRHEMISEQSNASIPLSFMHWLDVVNYQETWELVENVAFESLPT